MVDASRKAIDATKLAPFLKSDLVVAKAEKLHELLINPKKVPRRTLLDSFLPMVSFILFSVTNTCIMLLIKYPRPKAQNAIQKKPALVLAASPQCSKKVSMIVILCNQQVAEQLKNLRAQDVMYPLTALGEV